MRVTVRLASGSARRWHVDLLRRIEARFGYVPAVQFVAGEGRDRAAEARLSLEARLFGVRRSLSLAVDDESLAAVAGPPQETDIVLNLAPPEARSVGWRLAFGRDGRDFETGEAALLHLLRCRLAPVAAVMAGSRILAIGRLGADQPGFTGAFEDALARLGTLIEAALGEAGCRDLVSLSDEDAPDRELGRLGAARAVARAAAERVYRMFFRSPHWRVGWRQLSGGGSLIERINETGVWHVLEDDGDHFYADPFPIQTRAGLFLFVEDYPHAEGRAVISALQMGPDGPLGRPQPVLTKPWHLSYPFVFSQGGSLWMVPESSGAGTIDLYRANDFPANWVRVATLVEGVEASDATLLHDGGRWWMFATVRDGGGSWSDTLHLWQAPDFTGPWTPHAANPVLIDAGSARPAGRIVREGGVLWRPVQDCRFGYGRALGIARIDRLDETGFSQSIHAILRTGPAWPGRRLHTWNEAGGFAFIDGSALTPRFHWRSRPEEPRHSVFPAPLIHEPNITRSE